jgi:hypothetical protein
MTSVAPCAPPIPAADRTPGTPPSSRRRALCLGALLGATVVAGVGVTFLAPVQLGGRTTYVVAHGSSMAPALHDGDLAVVRPAGQYHIGDLVAVHSPEAAGSLVVHRLVGFEEDRIVLRADDETVPDRFQPTREALAGRVVVRIRSAGRWLSGLPLALPLGVVVMGSLAACTSRGAAPRPARPTGAERPA